MQPATRVRVLTSIIWLVPLVLACQAMGDVAPWSTKLVATATFAPTAVREVEAPATATPTPTTTRETESIPSPVVSASAVALVTTTSTPVPACSPVLSPTARPPDDVLVRETTISIPSYAYESYLREALDEEHQVPYFWLDRAAYGEPASASAAKVFKALVVENRYLRLTILPELGGRIYECIFKPTGQNIFYHNQVLKPTHWGPLDRDRNWWLAAGGMEWAFPVNEHGYEWARPWSYSIGHSGEETVVTVRDSTDADRPRVSVDIALAPGRSYFRVRPQIENPTARPFSYQYWTNAMLSLGGPSMSRDTEFVYPAEEVIVHSSGPRSGLPEGRSRMSWPRYMGKDMSWYYNWVDWLGFFIPQPTEDFIGAYDHHTELGIARIFPRQEVPGVKLYAHGLEFAYSTEYTDDNTQYFEIWGGPSRTFWPEDDGRLEPGESKTWSEYWYPLSGIGGLDFANLEGALNIEVQDGVLVLGLVTTSQQTGTIVVTVDGDEVWRQAVAVGPDAPYLGPLPLLGDALTAGRVSVRFLAADNEPVIAYESEVAR